MKKKTGEKILIIILIILCILIAIFARKAVILSKIDKKVTNYENNYKNIHVSEVYESDDYTSLINIYIKDDICKSVVEKTEKNGEKSKIIQIVYPNERKLFIESNKGKKLYVYEGEAPVRGSHIEKDHYMSYSVLVNYAYSMGWPNRILQSIVTKIQSTEINGKKCYKLSDVFEKEKYIVYVDKETGLTTKIIQENDNNKSKVNYNYSFNTVTDEDIKEPNISDYDLVI